MLSGMLKRARQGIILAIAAFACTLAAGPAYAGYLDFTADSVRAEEASGC
jgi:hypothetical protein